MAKPEEWEMIYARGLSVPRIAALCHAPANTVRHYLQAAVKRNAGLGQDHQANQPDPQRPSLEWRNKLDELEAFLTANGRFPWTSLSAPEVERRLGKWIVWQRRAHHGGTLSDGQVNALDRLGDWTTPERKHANDRHWHHQLTALEDTGVGCVHFEPDGERF